MEYLLILQGLLTSWFILNFEPLEKMRYSIVELLCRCRLSKLALVLICFKCCTFWLTLVLGWAMFGEFTFFEAAAASFIAYSYDTHYNNNIKLD